MSMRLVKVVSAAVAVSAATLSAQAGPMRVGGLLGINNAGFHSVEAGEDLGSRMAPLIGASLIKPLSPMLALQVDALISGKGMNQKDDGEEFTIKVNYFEVPVLLRLEFGEKTKLKPYVALGPSLAFKVGCKAEIKGEGAKISANCDTFADDEDLDFKSLDLGAAIGGGIDYEVGKLRVGGGLRYTHGLVKVIEQSTAKNRVLSIFASASIVLGN